MVMIPPGNIPFSGLIFWPFFLYRIICSPTSLLDLIIHKHLHCNSFVYILIFRGVDPFSSDIYPSEYGERRYLSL